jgi:hypothetical protein
MSTLAVAARTLVVVAALGFAALAAAHHSYAMFDGNRTMTPLQDTTYTLIEALVSSLCPTHLFKISGPFT